MARALFPSHWADPPRSPARQELLPPSPSPPSLPSPPSQRQRHWESRAPGERPGSWRRPRWSLHRNVVFAHPIRFVALLNPVSDKNTQIVIKSLVDCKLCFLWGPSAAVNGKSRLPAADFHASQQLPPSLPLAAPRRHPGCWTRSTATRRSRAPRGSRLKAWDPLSGGSFCGFIYHISVSSYCDADASAWKTKISSQGSGRHKVKPSYQFSPTAPQLHCQFKSHSARDLETQF